MFSNEVAQMIPANLDIKVQQLNQYDFIYFKL